MLDRPGRREQADFRRKFKSTAGSQVRNNTVVFCSLAYGSLNCSNVFDRYKIFTQNFTYFINVLLKLT